MTLHRWISVIRWIIVILTAGLFGLDMYLLKVFKDNQTVVLHWRWISQTALTGVIFWWTLITEINDSVARGKRARAKYDGSFKHKRKYRQRPFISWAFFWNVLRLFFYWTLCAAILQIAIRAMASSFRTVFALPFDRNSAEGRALHWDWSRDDERDFEFDFDDYYYARQGDGAQMAYNPRDLYKCGKYNFTLGQPLTMICDFDQNTLTIACVIALFTFIESLLTFLHDTRQMRQGQRTDEHELEVGAYHKGVEGHDFNYSQPEPLDPIVHATHSPVVDPIVPPLQQRPNFETIDNAHMVRPLPALPPRHASDSVEDLDVTPAYSSHGSDAAFKEGYAEDKKKEYETSIDLDRHDDGGLGSSTNPFAGQSSAGSSAWPQDVKK